VLVGGRGGWGVRRGGGGGVGGGGGAPAPPPPPAALQDDPAAIAAAATAAGAGLDAGLVQIETHRDGSRGDPVTVLITYEDPFRVPLVGWLVGSGVTMTASAVERQEFG